MTHYILASNSMGLEEDISKKLPQIKQLGEIETYLEGRDYQHGYYTYSEGDLKKFFETQGGNKHPHEFVGNPVKNRSDELAFKLSDAKNYISIVTEVEHPDETPDIIKQNYRKFIVRRKSR